MQKYVFNSMLVKYGEAGGNRKYIPIDKLWVNLKPVMEPELSVSKDAVAKLCQEHTSQSEVDFGTFSKIFERMIRDDSYRQAAD